MKFSVTQFGQELSKDKYIWDEETRTFTSEEYDLVLDFYGIDGVTFNTSDDCTFNTGSYCTFNTDSYCTFKTEFRCTFKTGSCCTFDTGSSCFFDTSHNCTFKTGSSCFFDTSHNCTFKTGSECVIVRRDVFEVNQVPENTTIKLNDYQIKGYEIIKDIKTKTITIDGKEIEISIEIFESLKEQLLEN